MPGKPKGSPKTGGRQKGTTNKATAEIKAIAQKHGEAAIKALVKLLNDEDTPPQTKVSAANSLLDRGYGKPAQAITGADDTPLFPTSIKVEIVSPKDTDS